MTFQTRESDGGVWIDVQTDEPVAVSVISDGEEVIYLPSDGSNSTYYVEESRTERTSSGFRVFHPGTVDSVELLESSA